MRSYAWLGAIIIGSAILPLACGGNVGSFSTSSAVRVCTPGAQVPCACPGGVWGAQRCTEDGTALGGCDCSGAGGSGSGGGSGGTETSSTSAGGSGGSTTSCVVDESCPVRWSTDIFAGILD